MESQFPISDISFLGSPSGLSPQLLNFLFMALVPGKTINESWCQPLKQVILPQVVYLLFQFKECKSDTLHHDLFCLHFFKRVSCPCCDLPVDNVETLRRGFGHIFHFYRNGECWRAKPDNLNKFLKIKYK